MIQCADHSMTQFFWACKVAEGRIQAEAMRIACSVAILAILMGRLAWGSSFEAVKLSLEPEQESVYAPPAPALAEEGFNEGAVHVDVRVDYTTAYVFRGIELLKPPGAS